MYRLVRAGHAGIGLQRGTAIQGSLRADGRQGQGVRLGLELKTKGSTDLYVVRNSIDPSGTSGWHRHPGPSLITVTAGEITAYDSDDPTCAPTVYRVGQGFIDDGDHAHMLRNETGEPAETVAVQFLAPGTTARRIDAPKPSHC